MAENIKSNANKKAITEPEPIEKDVPAGSFTTAVEAAVDARFRSVEGTVEKTSNLMTFGFLVLLITVAAVVVTVILDLKSQSRDNRDMFLELQNQRYQLQEERYELLKEQIQYKVQDSTRSSQNK